ncbi:MAG: diacylglycerol/lipid kinase family protein [Spirochaetaceae bacterium]
MIAGTALRWYSSAVKRFLVIYNRTAAQGRAGRRLPEVEELLSARGIDYILETTAYPGHAIELAREAATAGSYTAVVAAGGDGTTNEVLNGLMAARKEGREPPPLAVLSIGRGNDFAYGMGIPLDLAACVETLVSGSVVPMDVGYLEGGLFPEGRYFGNGIGIGFDTVVGFEAARMKRIKGFGAYVLGALKALALYYRSPMLRLVVDGREERRPCIQVSIMNGRRMGGAFFMAPKADPDDGALDICIAGTPTRRQMLGLILKYMKGAQEGHPQITMARATELEIASEGDGLAVHADGETVSRTHTGLTVRCIHHALEVLTG